MFFMKNRDTVVENLKPVALIGASPLAFFLADCLQNNGCDVYIVVSENKVSFFRKNSGLIVRTLNFQSRQISPKFVSKLEISPEICFITSTPESAKSDIMFLTEKAFKDVLLVNMVPFYNHTFLPLMNTVKTINAYFGGTLCLEKNIVQILNRTMDIAVCCNVKTSTKIKELLSSPLINLTFPQDSEKMFWKNFVPFFLENLMIAVYGSAGTKLLADTAVRVQAETAVVELCALVKKRKIDLEQSDVLTAIYTFSDDYKGELNSKQAFDLLVNVIPEINRFEQPNLYGLLASAVKKY